MVDDGDDDDGSSDDSMQGHGEAEFLREKFHASQDALREIAGQIEDERYRNKLMRHVLAKLAGKISAADAEILLQAGVVLGPAAAQNPLVAGAGAGSGAEGGEAGGGARGMVGRLSEKLLRGRR